MAGLGEAADHQDREDRRARRDVEVGRQPGLEEAVGQEHERQPDRNDDGEAECDPGEQVALLPFAVVGAFELRSGNSSVVDAIPTPKASAKSLAGIP